MISAQAQALIEYRMKQATEALASARLLLENQHYQDAVNRIYYSMFYATLALLISRGRRASKHTGALALLDVEFVRTGLLDKRFSRWLHEAFDLRHDSDYQELFEVSEEEVRESLEEAEAFVSEARTLLSPEKQR